VVDRFGLVRIELLNAPRLERTLQSSVEPIGERRELRSNCLHAPHGGDVTVRIVGQRERFEGCGTVVEDVFLDRGPLGGIHAALSSTQSELNLVLAVDLPLVTQALLEYMLERAQSAEAMVTAPHFVEGWQPLCAVYRKGFAQVAEEALLGGQNAIYPLLEGSTALGLDEVELEKAGFPRRMLRNINTVEDLAAL